MHRADTINALLKMALFLHREGRLAETEALYRKVLEIDPFQPLGLSMLGTILLNNSETEAAEALFLRHLEIAPDHPLTLHNLGKIHQLKGRDEEAIPLIRRAGELKPDLAPLFNDLAISLHRLGRLDEALDELDRALAVDPDFAIAHDNRGVVLYDSRRFKEAADAHQQALSLTPMCATQERAPILHHHFRAAYEAGELATAEHACRECLNIDPHDGDTIEYLAKTLYRLGHEGEALDLLNRQARYQGLTQETPSAHTTTTILILGGVGANHVPTRYLFDPTRHTTRTLTLLSPDQTDAPLGKVNEQELAHIDVIFNTLGEAEKQVGQAEPVKTLLAHLNKPVLNHPDRVARTGRDCASNLFGDIPGLRVPKVHWVKRNELSTHFTDPFLIRPAGSHGGEDLALINDPHLLAEYLAKVPYERFLLTDFHDFKSAQNVYRKYRFIFVDRQPFPCHLAIADNWLVHYWRAEMERSPWKIKEEEKFLKEWRQVFGPRGSTVIEQVGRRMDLDYGGLDCSLLPNGEILFFEANACMLVHLDDAKRGFPYKHESIPKIRDAVTQMINKKLALPKEKFHG